MFFTGYYLSIDDKSNYVGWGLLPGKKSNLSRSGKPKRNSNSPGAAHNSAGWLARLTVKGSQV